MTGPYNVLFLCTGNSARSIIAEALLNRLGEGRFVAWSAGSFPKGEVNPHTFPILKGLGFSRPIWPGMPMTAHWGVPDPAQVEGSEAVIAAAFGEASRELESRIRLFLSLPHESIDRMSLQAKLREIGAKRDHLAS